MWRKRASLAAGVVGFALVGNVAYACPPDALHTIVVPYPSGTTDAIARLIAEHLGYPRVVIENKGGADGSIGAGVVSRAEADGCSIVIASTGTIVGYPAMHRASPYTAKSYTDLGEIGLYTMMFFVNPTKLPGVTSMRALIEYIREHPGKVNWGRPTPTSRIALAQLLWLTLGAKEEDRLVVSVPYKGEAQAIQGLLAGDVDVVVATSAAGYEQVRSGSLIALATTGVTQSRLYPDVPNMRDAGIAQWAPAELTAGFYGPPNMQPKDVEEFAERVQRALEVPAVRNRLQGMGFEVGYLPPSEHAQRVLEQSDTWDRVIKYSGITPED